MKIQKRRYRSETEEEREKNIVDFMVKFIENKNWKEYKIIMEKL